MSLEDLYFDALKQDINSCEIIPSAAYTEQTDTVYVGGGTPSVPDSLKLCKAFESVRDKFSVSEGEFTIEVNPFSLSTGKARDYVAAGFNRISIGVQSLHDGTLKTLGRLHDRKAALRAIDVAAKAGFTNISCDLITGVPGQKLEEITEDADVLLAMGVKHISAYSLSIEEGTPFYDKYKGRLTEFVSEDEEREMYHGLRRVLQSRGMASYEISNSAYKGFESLHNLCYWDACEYYAFGAGSHGYLGDVRFAHPDNIKSYIENPSKVITEETLTLDDKKKEFCMLALRTSGGIDTMEYKRRFKESFSDRFSEEILRLTEEGLIQSLEGRIFLTEKGLDLANIAFMEFI